LKPLAVVIYGRLMQRNFRRKLIFAKQSPKSKDRLKQRRHSDNDWSGLIKTRLISSKTLEIQNKSDEREQRRDFFLFFRNLLLSCEIAIFTPRKPREFEQKIKLRRTFKVKVQEGVRAFSSRQ